jgi:hypothetical protein
MSKKYLGGFITMNGTPPTGGVCGSAPGIWSVDQATQYAQSNSWPVQPQPAVSLGYSISIPPIAGMTAFNRAEGYSTPQPLAWDTKGNLYTTGYIRASFAGNCCASSCKDYVQNLKFDKNLNLISTGPLISFSGTNSGTPMTFHYTRALAIDSSNNIYSAIATNSIGGSGSGAAGATLIKYDPSYNVSWNVMVIETNSGRYNFSMSMDSPANANTFIVGSRLTSCFCCGGSTAYNYTAHITKFNSSGTRQITTTTGLAYLYDSTVDTAGNTYIIADKNTPTQYVYSTGSPIIAKYDSSGSYVWGNFPTALYHNAIGQGITVDSSGNVYSLLHYYSGGGSEYLVLLIKCNSSGAIQWARQVYRSGQTWYTQRGSCDVDSAGNVYFCAEVSSVAFYVVKYDSTGVLQWQNQITGFSGGPQFGDNLKIGPDGFIYISTLETSVASSSSGVYYLPPIILKLNTNGNTLGTYTITSPNGNGLTETIVIRNNYLPLTNAAFSVTDNFVSVARSTITPFLNTPTTVVKTTPTIGWVQKIIS